MKKKGHESRTHGGHPLLKVKTEQVELESDGQQGEVVVSGHGNSTSETAYDRALMVQYKLESAHPSFIKLLSNTEANCSLLGIPMIFAARHIPHKFTWLVLEDESGCSQKVCYLPHRRMLSAGWSRFYQLHCLKEGDALVFQLVEPSKFKVYILKEDKHPEIKEAHGNGDVDAVVDEPAKRKCMNNPLSPNLEKKNKTSHQEDHVVVEVPASFDPKDINKFEISANGKVFNLHFSKETKQKYYNLCCSQTTLLHANLIEGLGDAMIITVISETVRVADAIKSSTLITTKDEFSALDRTLESFEVLGMRVGFLREWIKKLVNFSFESEDYGLVNLMYVEAVTNRSRVLEEIRNLEIRILELEEANAKFEGEIMRLNSKTEAREVEFRAMVKSFGSW